MLANTMVRTMHQYTYDIIARLLDLAELVSPEQWDAPQQAGQRSLHETLHHIIVVEEEYFVLCTTGGPIWDSRPISDYPDVASLRALNEQTYARYHPWLESLSEEELSARATYLMSHGVEMEAPIWALLQHMFFHSAQHRSEAAFMLTCYGHSPSFIDFFGYGFEDSQS